MSAEEEKAAHEIVIIRRRAHGEEEHGHSGLWKIAYADFMTALMAFFLVMWLVNAANKKTLQQVATYFNPMRMSDQVAREKGVHELSGAVESSDGPTPNMKGAAKGGVSAEQEAKDTDVDEQSTFKDPYGLLSKIASKATTFRRGQDQVPQGGSRNAANETFSGGEGYRDPFDPDYRHDINKAETTPEQLEVADGNVSHDATSGGAPRVGPETPTQPPAPQITAESVPAPALAAPEAQPELSPAPQPVARTRDDDTTEPGTADRMAARPAEPAAQPAPAASAPEAETQDAVPAGRTPKPESTEGAPDPAEVETVAGETEAKALQDKIDAIVAEARTAVPDVKVAATPEGLLVSIMDDAKFGMFAVGSAKPRPELVALMEKIADLLKRSEGPIVLRGHTDGRPYRSDVYDNWRLSTARAHMAYYMLVRAGLPEARFERVEGYADRKLSRPEDPGAAPNRRIEILLRRGQS